MLARICHKNNTQNFYIQNLNFPASRRVNMSSVFQREIFGSEKKRASGYKPKDRQFHLNIRKGYFNGGG